MDSSNDIKPPPAKRAKLDEIVKFINENERRNVNLDHAELISNGIVNNTSEANEKHIDNGPSTSQLIIKPAGSISFEAAKDFLSKKLKFIEETMTKNEIPKPIAFERRRKLGYKEILNQLSESFSIEDHAIDENSDKKNRSDRMVVARPTTRSLKRRLQCLDDSLKKRKNENSSDRNSNESINENILNLHLNDVQNANIAHEVIDLDFDYAIIRFALTGTRLMFIENITIWKQFKAEHLKRFPKLIDMSEVCILQLFEQQILPEVYTYKISPSECRVLNLCNLNPNYRRIGNGYVKSGFRSPTF